MSDPWRREHDSSVPRGHYHPSEHHPAHREERHRSRGFGGRRSRSSSSSPEPRREATVSRWEADVDEEPEAGKTLPSGVTVKVYSKADSDYNLTVRNNEVVMAPGRTSDDRQLWIKDTSWSSRVRDDGGHPAFALINKATGLALQEALLEGNQVRLAQYEPGRLDESVLWTVGNDIEDGYKAVRLANNTKLNLDAWQATTKNGGVHDGTLVCLYKWNRQPNQLWKIVPV